MEKLKWKRTDGVVRHMRVVYSGTVIAKLTPPRFEVMYDKFYKSPVLPNFKDSSRNLIQIQINGKSKS